MTFRTSCRTDLFTTDMAEMSTIHQQSTTFLAECTDRMCFLTASRAEIPAFVIGLSTFVTDNSRLSCRRCHSGGSSLRRCCKTRNKSFQAISTTEQLTDYHHLHKVRTIRIRSTKHHQHRKVDFTIFIAEHFTKISATGLCSEPQHTTHSVEGIFIDIFQRPGCGFTIVFGPLHQHHSTQKVAREVVSRRILHGIHIHRNNLGIEIESGDNRFCRKDLNDLATQGIESLESAFRRFFSDPDIFPISLNEIARLHLNRRKQENGKVPELHGCQILMNLIYRIIRVPGSSIVFPHGNAKKRRFQVGITGRSEFIINTKKFVSTHNCSSICIGINVSIVQSFFDVFDVKGNCCANCFRLIGYHPVTIIIPIGTTSTTSKIAICIRSDFKCYEVTISPYCLPKFVNKLIQ